MTKIMGIEELYVALEGKTERTEIEAILSKASIATLKEYIVNEGIWHEGWSYWKKADFIETIAVALMDEIKSRESVKTEQMEAGIEKYNAGDMTAGELDAILQETPTSALKEYAREKWIMLPPDNDRKEILKAVWEGILSEHFGWYDEEDEYEIPYAM